MVKKSRIVMIHGIQESSSAENLGKLTPFFIEAGFEVIQPLYGNMGYLTAVTMSRWINPRIADALASFIQPNDILVCHSNGATIAFLISQKIKIRGTILINPALDEDLVPTVTCFNHIYYNAGDWVVWLSSFVPFNRWGSMGRYGYRSNPRSDTLNIDCSVPPLHDLPPIDGHSDLFVDEKLAPWARYMVSLLKSHDPI